MAAMDQSTKSTDGGFLGIRGSIWGIVVLCIAIVLVLLSMMGRPEKDGGEENLTGEPRIEEKATASPPHREPVDDPAPDPDPPEFEADSPNPREPDFEIVAFETDLTVVFISRPSLGSISVEKYDSENKPTGQPLKSGTQVQIPDPEKPGAKIYFRIP
jgi:hypothetical protein